MLGFRISRALAAFTILLATSGGGSASTGASARDKEATARLEGDATIPGVTLHAKVGVRSITASRSRVISL